MSNSERKAHCGKKKHGSLLEAQIALKRTLAGSRKADPILTGLSAYKCPYCPGWHVGRSRMKGIDWDALARADAAIKARCAERAAGVSSLASI